MIRSPRQGFWRAQEGATAVEFALAATAFVLILFAILQFSIYFLTRVAMHDALSELATGQGRVYLASPDKSGTRNFLCQRLPLAQRCSQTMLLEMRPLNAATGTVTSNFAKGSVGTVMIVRAEAKVVIFVPFIKSISVSGKAVFLQS